MLKRKCIFKVQVNYKSGKSRSFWVHKFDFDNGKYTWTHVDDKNNPVILGVDNIESVWQIGMRTIWQWS